MSASQVDPHDKMRSRDVNKVAEGEQAPQPAHEPGTVSRPPPPKQVDKELSKSKKGSAHSDEGKSGEYHKRSDDEEEETVDLETAPVDLRFPFANQTRHCYARYLEYHRCIQEKGENAPECEKFARYYRSLCPSEWIEKWNEQREHGTFPGPL